MKPKRVDQILSQCGYCSRREAVHWVKRKRVWTVEGELIRSPSQKVDPTQILVDHEPIDHPKGLLVMLHKPQGYVCSHSELEGPSVFDLLPEQWMSRNPKPMSVGRLDRDTTGLLLITDLGSLVHTWTSPRHQVLKTYEVTVDRPLEQSLVSAFAQGDLVLPGENKPCLPAQLEIIDAQTASITISEGKFHQIKRMFGLSGYHVESLHRSQFGSLTLGDLGAGQFKELSLDLAYGNKAQEPFLDSDRQA